MAEIEALVEALARAACVAYGEDPDKFPPDKPATTGPTWIYPVDGSARPWHKRIPVARVFLAQYLMHKTYEEMTR